VARVTKRFPDTREGREAADAFAKSLEGAKRFYDVRISVNRETRMQSFTRRKDADGWIAHTGPDRLRGVVTDPRRGQVPFVEVVERWFKARTTKGPRSVDRDREIVRVHVLPAWRPCDRGDNSGGDSRPGGWVGLREAGARDGRSAVQHGAGGVQLGHGRGHH
jgi:hypothetical protein